MFGPQPKPLPGVALGAFDLYRRAVRNVCAVSTMPQFLTLALKNYIGEFLNDPKSCADGGGRLPYRWRDTASPCAPAKPAGEVYRPGAYRQPLAGFGPRQPGHARRNPAASRHAAPGSTERRDWRQPRRQTAKISAKGPGLGDERCGFRG